MPRVLTASHCAVQAGHEAEYLRTVRALAEECEARGQRLWVFRSAQDPRRFLEFTEAPSRMAHRVLASRTALELKLEESLRRLATYAPDAWELWQEVPLTATMPTSDGETDG